MEVEPLQDSLPDRYAIESDDSEDDVGQNIYPGVLPGSRSIKKTTYSAEFVWFDGGAELSGRRTCVAIGQAGLFWASGIHLLAPAAEIQLNSETVARVYPAVSTNSVIILLQYELPIDAMHVFASRVLTTLRPSNVTLVDGYQSPAYISSSHPIDPPIRYLQTRTSKFKPSSKLISIFRPPNLQMSTSAAFLNILEIEGKTDGLALLLPLPQIERPPPPRLQPISISVSWPESQISTLNSAILPTVQWDAKLAKDSGRVVASKKPRRNLSDDIGMSMYI